MSRYTKVYLTLSKCREGTLKQQIEIYLVSSLTYFYTENPYAWKNYTKYSKVGYTNTHPFITFPHPLQNHTV